MSAGIESFQDRIARNIKLWRGRKNHKNQPSSLCMTFWFVNGVIFPRNFFLDLPFREKNIFWKDITGEKIVPLIERKNLKISF